jgi:hypothetical protein
VRSEDARTRKDVNRGPGILYTRILAIWTSFSIAAAGSPTLLAFCDSPTFAHPLSHLLTVLREQLWFLMSNSWKF